MMCSNIMQLLVRQKKIKLKKNRERKRTVDAVVRIPTIDAWYEEMSIFVEKTRRGRGWWNQREKEKTKTHTNKQTEFSNMCHNKLWRNGWIFFCTFQHKSTTLLLSFSGKEEADGDRVVRPWLTPTITWERKIWESAKEKKRERENTPQIVDENHRGICCDGDDVVMMMWERKETQRECVHIHFGIKTKRCIVMKRWRERRRERRRGRGRKKKRKPDTQALFCICG